MIPADRRGEPVDVDGSEGLALHFTCRPMGNAIVGATTTRDLGMVLCSYTNLVEAGKSPGVREHGECVCGSDQITESFLAFDRVYHHGLRTLHAIRVPFKPVLTKHPQER